MYPLSLVGEPALDCERSNLHPLKSITIRGFRSIRALEGFAPGPLTAFIGPNGAGKSNVVEFFRMVRHMADEAFQRYAQTIGPETIFYMGPRQSPTVSAHLEFGDNVYEFDLQAQGGGGVFVAEERVHHLGGEGSGALSALGVAGPESRLKALRDDSARYGQGKGVPFYVHGAISSWTVYHVHDTSLLAPARGWTSVSNNVRLEHDAGNLAAVLLTMRSKHLHKYQQIRATVQLAAPFFDDFVLRPAERGAETQVRLEWTQRGSQEPFQPTMLSDGTLRFIAIVTALLQPSLPATLVFDEPELGLHPAAVHVLGETIRSAATSTQVILATQSPQLLDSFEPEHVVVIERSGGESTLRRLVAGELAEWLRDYSLGELWLKNVLGGRPALD